MIKRLHIKNFLSLRDIDVTLGETNVCVGANMTGKSALLRALKFLAFVSISSLNQTIREFGGFTELAWKGERNPKVSFEVEGEYKQEGGKVTLYEYYLEIAATPATGEVSVLKEKLTLKVGSGKKALLVDRSGGRGRVLHANKRTAFESPNATDSILQYDVPGWEGTVFRNLLARWRFYDLHPGSMRTPNAAVAQPYLSGNGNNLAAWLLTLHSKHNEKYLMILQAARDALPGLREVIAPPTISGTTLVMSREDHLLTDVSVFHMADGALKYLALLSLILAPTETGAPLVGVEEPDTNLHPRLLESLMTVYHQYRKKLGERKSQVIMTTHSPQLLDQMQLEDILVFAKKEGATSITRPSNKKHLRELLTSGEASLGELMFRGALSDEI